MRELLAKSNAKDTELTSLKTKMNYEKQQKEEEMFELRDYADHLEVEVSVYEEKLKVLESQADPNYQAPELTQLRKSESML